MRYVIALDIHKRETQAYIVDEAEKLCAEKRFRTLRASFRRVLSKYPEGDAIIESVGFHRPVAAWLKELGYTVHLAHTGRIPKPRVKTDRKDAKHLARLFRGGALPEAYLPVEEVQRLRDIARQRQFLGQQARQLKSKIRQDLNKHGHFVEKSPLDTALGRNWLQRLDFPEINSALALLAAVEDQIEDFEERIRVESRDLPEAKLLTSIPGVGPYTALLILAEVADFSRFANKDAVAAYAGLAVRQQQSGDSDKRGSITKEGSGLLRWALVEAARNHVMHCPESALSRRHKRLAKRRGNKKAVVATARVMATVMYTMVKRNEEFRLDPPKPGYKSAA